MKAHFSLNDFDEEDNSDLSLESSSVSGGDQNVVNFPKDYPRLPKDYPDYNFKSDVTKTIVIEKSVQICKP